MPKAKKFKMINSIYMNSISMTRHAGQTFVTDNEEEQKELLKFVKDGTVLRIRKKKPEGDDKDEGKEKGKKEEGKKTTTVDLAELPGIGAKTVEKLAALDPPIVTVEGVKDFVQKQPEVAETMMGRSFETVQKHFAPAKSDGDDAGGNQSSREGGQK